MTLTKNIKILASTLPLLFVAYIAIQLFVPSNIGSTQVEIEIPEGASFRQAVSILYDNNLIRDRNIFFLIGKLGHLDRKIRAGFYAFWGSMSPLQSFRRLLSGRIIEYEVTIVEGDSLPEISRKLANSKLIGPEKFRQLSTDYQFMKSLEIEAPSLEGYLYPQTYRFPKGANPANILKLMVNKLKEEYNDDLQERTEEIGWTENEVLTLASIVEREAVTDEERPIISAVYHNRLRKGMPLQADPTAIYGVKSYRFKITGRDVRKKTEYNTYRIKGLPPGPIASPGVKSINAALYPANVPYLYFVSKGNGTHYFSKTMKEHTNAINRVRAARQPDPEAEEPDETEGRLGSELK
jgi:UPF0755 protein